MTRDQVKAGLLILTCLIVCTAPAWEFRTFTYVIGALASAVGLYQAGRLLELYLGFRRFDKVTESEYRARVRGRR